MNERDKLLQATSPRLNDPAGVDPLIITASTTVLKFEVDPANPLNIIPANGTVVLYALCDRPGDISWSIVGEPISGVSLSSNTGSTVTLTYTSSLAVEGIVISASATNNLYSPATLTKQLTLSRQVPAKTIKNVEVFKRSSTALTKPTGGSYVFSTNSITAPIGWSITIPVGTDPVYVSRTQVSSYSSSSSTPITIVESWSSPAILAQNGAKGDNGTNGTNGRRGSVDIAVLGSTWTTTAADNAIYNATGSYTKYAGDKVTIYNNAGFAETHYWDGIGSWVTGQIINGNMLVTGTITSDKIGTNELSAVNVNTTGRIRSTGSYAAGYVGGVKAAVVGENTSTETGESGVFGYGRYALYGQCNQTGTGGNFEHAAVFAINTGAAGTALWMKGFLQWTNNYTGVTYRIAYPDGDTTKFLRADGTWATPSTSGGVTSFNTRTGAISLTFNDVYTATSGYTLNVNCNYASSAGSASTASTASTATNSSQLGGYVAGDYVRYVSTTSSSGSIIGYLLVQVGATQGKIAIYG
jgi:hypothetical protein